MAKGLDCGTSFYIAATEDTVKKQRNAFLTVDGQVSQVKRMLKRQGIPFVEKAGKVHIVGQHAFNYAQIFSTSELKRPMKSGLLNPTEKDALPVLNAMEKYEEKCAALKENMEKQMELIHSHKKVEGNKCNKIQFDSKSKVYTRTPEQFKILSERKNKNN